MGIDCSHQGKDPEGRGESEEGEEEESEKAHWRKSEDPEWSEEERTGML